MELQVVKQQSFAKVFPCLICKETVFDARLCLHCSKPCLDFIQKWLTEQQSQCHNFRTSLSLHKLVDYHGLDIVPRKLNNLQNAETAAGRMDYNMDRCDDHQEKLNVYCCTCFKFICYKCFGGDMHSGHSFKLFNEVHDEYVNTIKKGQSRLRRRIEELQGFEQEVERTVQSVQAANDKRLKQMDDAVKLIKARLNSQLTNKFLTLTGQKNSLVQEASELESLTQNLDQQLELCSKRELVAKNVRLIGMINQSLSKPMSSFVPAPVHAVFDSEIVPQFYSSTFVMNNFTALKAKADPVYSPWLFVDGVSWCLKVFPDGDSVERGNYLSVYLKLSKSLPEMAKYEYVVELVHPSDSTKNVVVRSIDDIQVGEYIPHDRLFRLDLLVSEGFLDTEKDTLVLCYYVRSPTFCQKSLHQQWYIRELWNDRTNLKSRILNLEKILETEGSKNQDSSAIRKRKRVKSCSRESHQGLKIPRLIE